MISTPDITFAINKPGESYSICAVNHKDVFAFTNAGLEVLVPGLKVLVWDKPNDAAYFAASFFKGTVGIKKVAIVPISLTYQSYIRKLT